MTELISREQLIQMYAAYPGALEQEVAQAFARLENDEQRIGHNEAMRRISRLISTEDGQRLMWKNVAQAIIETAMHEPTGVKTSDRKTE